MHRNQRRIKENEETEDYEIKNPSHLFYEVSVI